MRRFRTTCLLLAAASLAGLASATVASATTVPAWGRAQELTLPADATTDGDQNAGVAVDCSSPGNCAAAGAYINSSDNGLSVMEANEADGAWGAARAITPPSDAGLVNGQQQVGLSDVSCSDAGNCVAVGEYINDDYASVPMAATETNGVWAQAVALSPPANTDTGAGAGAALLSVSCVAQGDCTAAGWYTASTGYAAMTITETGGSWSQGQEVQPPADARVPILSSVDCNDTEDCTAVGDYLDENDNTQPMAVSEESGDWNQAEEVALPTNAAITAGGQKAELNSVSCTASGDCTASGFYVDTDGNSDVLTATSTDSRWAQSRELTALPANATTSSGAQNAEMWLDCSTAGNCISAGDYVDASGQTEAMTGAEIGGAWSQARELVLPSNAANTKQSAYLGQPSCTGAGECGAGGAYVDASGGTQAMVVSSSPTSSVPPVSISTTTLPAGALGARYQAKLTATGGSGTDTWSAKALPAGLHLNASTGAITGTPTKTGTTHVTITVTSAGHSATTTLTITIAGLHDLHLTLHGQHLTLGIPAACVATNTKLRLTLTTKKTKNAWTFSHAGIYLNGGITHHTKHHSKTITTHTPNHTITHLPATLALTLKNRKPGKLPLEIIITLTHHKHTAARSLKHTITLCAA